MVGVSEKRERQRQFLLELGLRRDGVGAHAKNDCIQSLEPRERVTKLGRLDGSPRGIGLGIEVEHDALAHLIGERERLALIGE